LRAVKEFETSLQLPADGLVGRLTWSELVVSVKAGHKGDAVRAAQTLLNVSGHAMDIDGLYGPATQDSVVEFQRSHRLNVDGIVDADTWRLLLAEASR
jgi:peptidoglycan hydrolase-like protein with peptidoglycan-binding domain